MLHAIPKRFISTPSVVVVNGMIGGRGGGGEMGVMGGLPKGDRW